LSKTPDGIQSDGQNTDGDLVHQHPFEARLERPIGGFRSAGKGLLLSFLMAKYF